MIKPLEVQTTKKIKIHGMQIVRERERLGLSQAQAAELMGITQQTYSGKERPHEFWICEETVEKLKLIGIEIDMQE